MKYSYTLVCSLFKESNKSWDDRSTTKNPRILKRGLQTIVTLSASHHHPRLVQQLEIGRLIQSRGNTSHTRQWWDEETACYSLLLLSKPPVWLFIPFPSIVIRMYILTTGSSANSIGLLATETGLLQAGLTIRYMEGGYWQGWGHQPPLNYFCLFSAVLSNLIFGNSFC